MRKPRPFSVGSVRVAPMRKPTKSDPRWYWRAKVYRDGAEQSVWSARATRLEAERAVAAIVADNDLVRPRAPAPCESIATVGDLLDAWLEEQDERTDIRPATKANKHCSANRLRRVLGAVRLPQVRQRTLERYRDTLAGTKHARGDGYSSGSIALDLLYFGEAWTWGREIGACPGDLPSIRIRQRPVMDKRTPTHADVCAVVAHATERWRPAIELLAATGCRIGEVVTLRAEDVNAARGEITVRGKTGVRVVPVRREILDRLPAHAGVIWGCTEWHAKRMIRREIDAACAAEEIPRFTPHGLRRYAADRMVDTGIDLKTVADLLGHSVAMLLKRYRQSTERSRRDAIARAGLGDFGGASVHSLEEHRAASAAS